MLRPSFSFVRGFGHNFGKLPAPVKHQRLLKVCHLGYTSISDMGTGYAIFFPDQILRFFI